MRMHQRVLFAIFLCWSYSLCAQEQARQIDSLKKLVHTPIHDTIKAMAYSDLCYYYRFISVDSALYFGELALNTSQKSRFKKGEAQAYNDLGIIYSDTDQGEKAIEYYNNALNLRLMLRDSLGVAGLYMKIGIVQQENGDYKLSIDNQQIALKIYEALGYNYGAASVYNNIAILHEKQGMLDLALKYYYNSLELKEKINDKEGIAGTLINIGIIYYRKKDIDATKSFFNKALASLDSNSNKGYLASLYNNFTNAYADEEKYDSALYFSNKSVAIREQASDKKGLASSFNKRAVIYIKLKKYKQALKDLENAELLAVEATAKPELYEVYKNKAVAYEGMENLPMALKYLYSYTTLKDSVENESIALRVSELQTQYETEKKEQQIKIQELTISEQEAELKRNRIQVASSVGGIVVLMVVLALLYNAKRLREQVLALETAQKLQSERERISSDLHDHVGAQLTSIISGLQMTETVGNVDQSPQFKQLVDSLKEDAQVTITHLRDTIWTLKEEEISPSEFAEHIQKFAESALRYREKPVFNIQNSAPDTIKLNPSAALNITRVVEEAIHNVIKHAEADNLSINISGQEGKFEVEIKDDGKGFDTNSNNGLENYGLSNMKRRMEELGGSFSLISNKGTQIRITL